MTSITKPSKLKTLYIIHGWAYSVDPWKETIRILRENGVPVKMLRVPGLTESSDKIFTIDDYVAWADKNLPAGCLALGHSNGGRILLNLAVKDPGKLGHLILLDSAGVYEASKKRDLSRRLSKMFAPLKKIPGAKKLVHKALGASDYDHAPENMKQTLSNMLDSDKSLKLSKVTVPTTIIWGESDSVTPLRQGEKMHAEIENSRLITRKNWRHSPYIADPAGLAKVIYSVVREQSAPAAARSSAAAKGARG